MDGDGLSTCLVAKSDLPSEESQVEIPASDMFLRVITLNCWGLRFVSRHRQQRIKSIAQHLREQEYDIVFLQELWCQSDFESIRSTTGYKFAHYFKTSCILGTSGLAILSKWAPENIHFEPYTLNGSPFKPYHGDWFAGKGVAYARIDLLDLRLHLFCTHMHAQYDEMENIGDMYSIHRICQAYQLSKFINLVAENSTHSRSGSDLILLAGDLNTSPGELPFKLLMSMTGLVDCCMHRYSHDVRRTLLHGVQDIQVDEDLITCGHHMNTYSVTTSSQTTISNHASRELTSKPSGKRIDFILFKLAQKCRCEHVCECEIKHSCFGSRVECQSKDPITGLSFSDHQPVSVKLIIKRHKTQNKSISSANKNHSILARRHHTSLSDYDEEPSCLGLKERALKAITSQINFKNGSIYPTTGDENKADEDSIENSANETSDELEVDDKNGLLPIVKNGTKARSQSFGQSLHGNSKTVTSSRHRSSSSAISDFETEESRTIQQNVHSATSGTQPSNPSNVLLDILPKRSGSNVESTTTTILSQTKVHFSPETAITHLDEPSLQHLESAYKLLADYLNENHLSKQRFYLFVVGLVVILVGATSILGQTVLELNSATVFHLLFIIILTGITVLLLNEFSNRFERTAIKGILEEVAALISFAPNAPLAH